MRNPPPKQAVALYKLSEGMTGVPEVPWARL